MTWAYDPHSRTNYDPATDEPICILSDLASVDTMHARGRLIAVAPDMREALAEFVRRVDAGEVKSRKTYSAFKAILARTEPQP